MGEGAEGAGRGASRRAGEAAEKKADVAEGAPRSRRAIPEPRWKPRRRRRTPTGSVGAPAESASGSLSPRRAPGRIRKQIEKKIRRDGDETRAVLVALTSRDADALEAETKRSKLEAERDAAREDAAAKDAGLAEYVARAMLHRDFVSPSAIRAEPDPPPSPRTSRRSNVATSRLTTSRRASREKRRKKRLIGVLGGRTGADDEARAIDRTVIESLKDTWQSVRARARGRGGAAAARGDGGDGGGRRRRRTRRKGWRKGWRKGHRRRADADADTVENTRERPFVCDTTSPQVRESCVALWLTSTAAAHRAGRRRRTSNRYGGVPGWIFAGDRRLFAAARRRPSHGALVNNVNDRRRQRGRQRVPRRAHAGGIRLRSVSSRRGRARGRSRRRSRVSRALLPRRRAPPCSVSSSTCPRVDAAGPRRAQVRDLLKRGEEQVLKLKARSRRSKARGGRGRTLRDYVPVVLRIVTVIFRPRRETSCHSRTASTVARFFPARRVRAAASRAPTSRRAPYRGQATIHPARVHVTDRHGVPSRRLRSLRVGD